MLHPFSRKAERLFEKFESIVPELHALRIL